MIELPAGATFALFVAFMALIPYVFLSAPDRRVYMLLDVSTYAALAAFVIAAPILGIAADMDFGLALLIVIKLTIFSVFCIARHETVRWSATKAGILAGGVYLLLVPHVLRFPVDGDEPYYVLIAESMLHDQDLDLANQYRSLADSAVGRTDLKPQPGDPTGPNGELYSRHEPFLALLLVPGLLLAGLPGAVATIAIFGGLLIRSVHLLLEESGVSRRVQLMVFPFIALGPPVVFYATRIWPEIPAAFLFAELLRSALWLESGGKRKEDENREKRKGEREKRTEDGETGKEDSSSRASARDLEDGRRGIRNILLPAHPPDPSLTLGMTSPLFAFAPSSFLFPLFSFLRPSWARFILAALGIGLLKLRFVIVVFVLLTLVVFRSVREGRGRWMIGAAIMVIVIPFVALLAAHGNPMSVHGLRELIPQSPAAYATGVFGLLADGGEGLLFQAPAWFLAILALARWRSLGSALRMGMISALPYLVLLVPRAEWHGGWSPPLRYLVVFTPLFALGIAEICERLRGWRSLLLLSAIGSVVVVVHGIAFPWRLFHLADGQNVAGEWLSRSLRSDFTRMFPSFIRLNEAGIIAGVVIAILFAVLVMASRWFWTPATESDGPGSTGGTVAGMACLALLITLWLRAGLTPGHRVEFEDAHVEHTGGMLFPDQWTPMRFLYRCGWTLQSGDSMTFKYTGGVSVLHYVSQAPVVIEIDGKSLTLQDSHGAWSAERADLPEHGGRVSLRVIRGTVTLERIERFERE